MVLTQVTQSAVHCINPYCQRPYPQPWGNKFCNSCGTSLQLLDRYYPLNPLGSGGFAQIYTVWDEKTQTEKVLKVLVEESSKALELFIQEAEVLSNFRHPGVPRVDADGYFQLNLTIPKPHQLACLVMEKIDGQTLEEIRRSYPQGCPEDAVLNWFSQAVKILQELHKRQIIHRDIKPSNLMLRSPAPTAILQAEQLVLIDFGGAKQFSGMILRSHSPSTRLYSSGYSPPEQVVGGNVGPAADFYALGRTMIELLTGKCPQDLEDPITGKLLWRNRCNVDPRLAELLDQMIQEDVRSRPGHAAIIQRRLQKILKSSPQSGLLTQLGNNVQQVLTLLSGQLAKLFQALNDATVFTVQSIFNFLIACVATMWAMFLSSMGAGIGAIAGFIFAYQTKLGNAYNGLHQNILEFIALKLPQLLANTQTTSTSEILVYACAGLGTAWGLSVSGCFGQKPRLLTSSLIGAISYSFGWIVWQFIQPHHSKEGLLAWILISVSLLILGLGLRTHQLAYALIASLGSANILTGLIRLNLPLPILHFSTQPNLLEIFPPIAFFGFIGSLISLCLGISYYLIIPCLRWLGWR
ncbi:serine/threonine-protein kinase [Cronbergia sp. UHCC 0137]|uniref:serine/threonine-protein kinase n=1 Tax=Cronbergia sp. UHCC 0137 TaxID=3110239 RepID=UPI002B20A8A4|nr:serine/threonine-protein kinase [Cronbergia sp. UHCC 0137]MEA5616330.1 serine/threonine-protein kinase [Cronbergia sp. UHCC 0137]